MKELSDRVVSALYRAGLKHNELADRAEFDAAQLTRLKKGEVDIEVIGVGRIGRLAKTLGVNVSWIVWGEGEREHPSGMPDESKLPAKERFQRVAPSLGVPKPIIDRVMKKYASAAYDRDPPYDAEFFDARAREMMRKAHRVRDGIAATKYALEYNKKAEQEKRRAETETAPRSRRKVENE